MATPEFSRVKAIVSEALELTGRDREAFIDQSCGDDAELRSEVLAYLRAGEEAGEVLGPPGASFPAETAAVETANQPEDSDPQLLGSSIGDYTLLELIGEGGFGAVFMAEQREPVRRQVALKILKLGMNTRRVIRRFQAERQMLAIMDHPNIARVFDAGATDNGRPYFVMELVRGVPITEHCDAYRLSIVQRLELFVIVCNAIQHAHNKGIIHRDIKPNNVLVTTHDGQAVPKVIDFGIAKATDTRPDDITQVTEAHQFIGTPGYMAPEQAQSGLDIDTRADIYSLGVLLYVLLTGSKPFDGTKSSSSEAGEAQRLAGEADPPKPSTRLSTLGEKFAKVAANRNAAPYKLKQQIHGELDWIVMKAIEKDRARRYETASELARDIRRHLSNEPIDAGPPTASYRMRKFIRRHRRAVVTSAAFAVMIAAAIGVYIHGMRREQHKTDAALLEARHQRAQADERRIEAQQASGRALAAEARANEELVRAAISSARAARASTYPGRRFDSLRLLATAARINSSAEVRSEAIACMGLADMRIIKEWSGNDRGVTFDHACAHFADCTAGNEVVIRAIPDAAHPDGALVTRLPAGARIDPHLPDGTAAVVFSPDDQQVAVHCDDDHVRVFTLDAKPILDIEDATGCDFSPNGRALATSKSNGSIVIHYLKSGSHHVVERWPGTDTIAFSPDGRKLAMWNVGRATDVCIGEIDTGFFNRCSHNAGVRAVAWHPAAKMLATSVDDRGILLWDVGSTPPKLMQTMIGHTAPISSLSFTHGGELLASASLDGTIRLWDPLRNEQLVRAFCSGSLSFRGDDRMLAAAAPNGRHTLIEIADGLERRALSLPADDRDHVDLSRDGSLVAAEGSRTVRFWNLTSPGVNENRADLIFPAAVQSITFCPLSECVFIGTTAGLHRFSIEELPPRDPEESHDAPPMAPSRRLQIGRTRELLLPLHLGADAEVELSWDGSHLAVAQNGQAAVVIDLRHRADSVTLVSSADTSFISISPNAKFVAGASHNGTGDHRVNIWDAAAGKLIKSLPISSDARIAFSPDGHWLATATAEELCLWEVDSWQPRRRRAAESSLSSRIFFSPDSRLVALGSRRAGVRVLDVGTLADVATLEDEPDARSAGFSPDGTFLATRSRGTTLHLWNLRQLRTQLQQAGLNWPQLPLPPEVRPRPRIEEIRTVPIPALD